MNFEFLAQIVLIFSLMGLATLVFRKIPVLANLSEVPLQKKESTGFKLKEKIKLNLLKNFSYEIFLQKLLSKIRILTLKTENKTFNWLQKLREKAQKKKLDENDKYWEEVKKNKDKNEQ